MDMGLTENIVIPAAAARNINLFLPPANLQAVSLYGGVLWGCGPTWYCVGGYRGKFFMKTLLCALFLLVTLCLHAQYSVLKVIVQSPKTRVIQIDGKDYPSDNIYRNGKANEFTITDLGPGQHAIMISSLRGAGSVTPFTLSSNYDMTIGVEKNGNIQISQKRKIGFDEDPRMEMTADDFVALARTLESVELGSQREFGLTQAFLNRDYHFSSPQIITMLGLVKGPAKLRLAKLSYGSILKAASFDSVINVFAPGDKNSLRSYIAGLKALPAGMQMAELPFGQLKQLIDKEWLILEKDKAIMAAFLKRGNLFSTDQARQLIEMSGTEAARILLAAASFSTLTDKENFNSFYYLFRFHASKNEVSLLVFRQGEDFLSRIPGLRKDAISSADFTVVMNEILDANEDMRAEKLARRFAYPYAAFTTGQVAELVQLVKDESNRLSLLKDAWRVITDRANFNTLSDLLWLDENRKSFAAYRESYHGT